MKQSIWLLLGLAVAFTGCRKDKGPGSPPKEVEAGPKAQAEAALSPADAAKATEEEDSSVVSIRIIAGALPVQDFAGALLHPDELKGFGTYFDRNRCVYALLKGIPADRLHDAQTRILVFRNLPGPGGKEVSMAYEARLARFEESTGLAAFVFNQGFSARTDAGFHLAADGSYAGALQAIRLRKPTGAAMPAPPIPPARGTKAAPAAPAAPFPVDRGTVQREAADRLQIKFSEPGTDSTPDENALVASSPGRLRGFVAPDEKGGIRLIPVSPIGSGLELPEYRAISVKFTDSANGVRLLLKAEGRGGESLPKQAALLVKKLDGAESQSLEVLQSAVAAGGVERNSVWLPEGQGGYMVTLDAPPEGAESAYALALDNITVVSDGKAPLFLRPILITLSRQNGVIKPKVEGATNLSEEKAADDTGTSKFAMENRVLAAFAVAGGAEVIMQLDGAPYWKRFSMEKKDWLPLPAVDLTKAKITANRSNLYIFDGATSELSRYRLSDLQKLMTMKPDINNGEVSQLLVGCGTDRQPLYVYTNRGRVTLDPETLEGSELPLIDQLGTSQNTTVNNAPTSEPAGDGVLSQTPILIPSAAYNLSLQGLKSCANLQGAWLDLPFPPRSQEPSKYFTFRSAPVFARSGRGNPDAIPPEPAHVQLVGFGANAPFGEVDVPEMIGLTGHYGEDLHKQHLLFLDSRGQYLGVVTDDRMQWIVRPVKMKGEGGPPALLNWPETSVARGEEFQFHPELRGVNKVTAILQGMRETTTVSLSQSEIRFKVSPKETARLLLLKLTLTGTSSETEVAIPIYVSGPTVAYVTRNPDYHREDPQLGIAGTFKEIGRPSEERVPVESTLVPSGDRIMDILGVANGFALLLTEPRDPERERTDIAIEAEKPTKPKHLEFLSLAEKRIVGAMEIPEKAKYFAGGGAVFEYDGVKRTFTRISVPDQKRGPVYTLPANTELNAVGLGHAANQPLTIVLVVSNPALARQQNYRPEVKVVVVNPETFKAGQWKQPVPLPEKSNGDSLYPPAGIFDRERLPISLPGSEDGSFLHMNRHVLVTSPQYAVISPVTQEGNLFSGFPRLTGSLSGIIVSSDQGRVWTNGLTAVEIGNGVSACGRYVISKDESASFDTGPNLDVMALDGKRHLFTLNRLAAPVAPDAEHRRFGSLVKAKLLGKDGPLLVTSRGGHLVQLMDFDIARLAKEASPSDAHIISQPPPYAFEGAVYSYQVQVNNPEQVETYRFRHPLADAVISPSGLLQVKIPQGSPMQKFDCSLELVLKDKSIFWHDFSVLVLPRQMPSGSLLQPTPSARPGASL